MYDLIYIASPYSHSSDVVMRRRFVWACQFSAKLMREGKHVFSPIAHTHPIAEHGELDTGWDYWQAYGRCMLSKCTSMVVLMIEGWDTSKGVQAEIEIAKEMGIPITYAEFDL